MPGKRLYIIVSLAFVAVFSLAVYAVKSVKVIDYGMLPGLEYGEKIYKLRLGGFETRFISVGDRISLAHPKEKDPPIAERTQLVRRVLGLPGQEIEIKNRMLHINQKPQEEEYVAFTYRIQSPIKPGLEWMSKYHIPFIQETALEGLYDIILQPAQIEAIGKDEMIAQCRLLDDPSRFKEVKISPFFLTNTWTLLDYGPFMIPYKNLTIELTSANWDLYNYLIKNFERKALTEEAGHFLIDGNPAKFYTFEKDYFFVLSDNRDFGNDSRTFGLLPSELIQGIILF
ncbi:MAG: S26 family signal peptidase [Bacteroidales bacterium]|nr:S26 family signal peptidase [Bacteroidales bacterium]